MRERLLERNYWRKVSQIQGYFGFSDRVMEVVQKYEEVLNHLEQVRLGMGELGAEETVERVSVTFNGLLVYEEEVSTGAYLDAIPRRPVLVEVVELLVNQKLAFLLVGEELVWSQIDFGIHQGLVEQLRGTQLWQEALIPS